VLDVADKLGSVLSSLVGLLGVVLTAYGLWLQRRRSAVDMRPIVQVLPPPPPVVDDEPTVPLPRLHIPRSSEWVPDSRHLPPGKPRYPSEPQPGYGSAPVPEPAVPPPPGQPPGVPIRVPPPPAYQPQGEFTSTPEGPHPWHRRPVSVLVTGLGLVGLALGLAVVTVLL
jgi:hypothetical protein